MEREMKKMRWGILVAMLVLFGTGIVLSACSNAPGYNAYGRYSDKSDKVQPYDGDWYKAGTD
jgi:hypothetical protein